MKPIIVDLALERETKHFVLYVATNGGPVSDIYVRKTALPTRLPLHIRVTVEQAGDPNER